MTQATAPASPGVPPSGTIGDPNTVARVFYAARPSTIRLLSAFGHIGKLAPQQVWDGVVGRAVHGERLTMGVIELDPDSVVPEHHHENEQLGMVLAGSLRFRVGEETRELGPGDTWSIPADVPHEVETGPDGAVVLDVFAPVREDWRTLDRVERSPRWP